MTTLKDIAIRANVSTCTVSRYLSKSIVVKKETEDRIKKALDDLGYVTNTVAKSLRRNTTMNVAVVLPRINNLYYSEMTSGIGGILASHGYNLIIYEVENHDKSEDEAITWLRENMVAGVVFIGMSYDRSFEAGAQKLWGLGIPVVYANRLVENFLPPLVYPDYEKIGALAAEHLRGLGRRKVAIVHQRSREEMLRLYRRKFAEVYGADDATGVFEATDLSFRFLGGLRDTGFDAAFVLNEAMAVRLCKEAVRGGWDLPGDFAILAFGNSPISRFSSPEVSCIDLHDRRLGALSAELLMGQIQGGEVPKATTVEPELIRREST